MITKDEGCDLAKTGNNNKGKLQVNFLSYTIIIFSENLLTNLENQMRQIVFLYVITNQNL